MGGPARPESWTPTATRLLPLGSGKLCVARCFRRTKERGKLLRSEYGHENAESFAVLAGVEVVRDAGTRSLEMIQHKSELYSVGKDVVKPL